MTRYRVRHVTTYRYGAPVTSGLTLAHLLPRTTSDQQVLSASVLSDPVADHGSTYLDGFGNLATFLGVEQPHDAMVVTADSEVDVTTPPREPDGLGPPWDEVGGWLLTDTTSDGLLARTCTLASPLVDSGPDLATYATPSFPPGRPVIEGVRDLSTRIFHDFVFDPSFSDVATPVLDVLQARRGVCQDFAHLAVGCLRSLGLPARYVSGYIETTPPPGEPKLAGTDASHAWCSVYVPGSGWLDVDPTNDQVPPRNHVTVAWGRDYGDVAPVQGVVFGPATTQQLTVAVDVVALHNVDAPGHA